MQSTEPANDGTDTVSIESTEKPAKAPGRFDWLVLGALGIVAVLALMWTFVPGLNPWAEDAAAASDEAASAQIPAEVTTDDSIEQGLSEDGLYYAHREVWPDGCALDPQSASFNEHGILIVEHQELDVCFFDCGPDTERFVVVGPFLEPQDELYVAQDGQVKGFERVES